MLQQPKKVHECPNCKAPLKRTIGAQTRSKYWVCTKGGELCYRVAA